MGDNDVPKAPVIKEIPCHKKNSDLGTKHVYYDSQIFIEQDDALTFKKDEEVSCPQNTLFAQLIVRLP
jgi:hypothetical protein